MWLLVELVDARTDGNIIFLASDVKVSVPAASVPQPGTAHQAAHGLSRSSGSSASGSQSSSRADILGTSSAADPEREGSSHEERREGAIAGRTSSRSGSAHRDISQSAIHATSDTSRHARAASGGGSEFGHAGRGVDHEEATPIEAADRLVYTKRQILKWQDQWRDELNQLAAEVAMLKRANKDLTTDLQAERGRTAA